MSEGLTFPQNPQDGQTISFSFQHTGGAANNAVTTKTWSWNASRNAWVSNYSNTQGGEGGGVGSQGPTGPTGAVGSTGTVGSIFVNNIEYTDINSLKFFSDHSITHSSSNNTLTITFGSEFGSISGNSKTSGIARWDYTVYKADFNGSGWDISSPSVTAYNLFEYQNTGTTAYGISVTGDQGITLRGFTGFAIMSVPNGTIVELTNTGGKYFFSAPNPIDGIC